MIRLRRRQQSGEPDGAVLDLPGEPEEELPPGVRPPRANRTIVVVAVTAVASLAAGIGVSNLVISPAQRAAEAAPPEAGLITVPVEERELSTDLTLRGDALYDDPVSVALETTDMGGPAIVTGQVPEVGDLVEAGQVVMEVAGRPVVVLPGELPVYRTLRVGSSGPDVTQLKAALHSLGLNAGNRDSDVFDAATSAAVDALYQQAGYASPVAEEGADEALTAAREGLRMAEEAYAQAQAEVNRAAGGLPRSERLRLDTAVARAERAVQLAAQEGAEAVTQAREELAVVRVEREEALAAPDTSAERSARDAAATAVEDAARALAEARSNAMTPLPAAEVVYVDTLPRRVDSVMVRRGDTVSGEALTISGATLQVLASVSDADATLVPEGTKAYFTVGDEEIEATVTETRTPSARPAGDGEGEGDGGGGGGGARHELVLVPTEITEEQRAQIVGSNVRVTIPLESTGGEVLVVPVAALTAGAGGESRVEVERGEARTEIVVVQTGLTADGYVEVSGEGLTVGDLVVVGR
ncbi:hypothetical protein M3148_07830 [Georgenia satyanarayanai]|uniref:hypothetical protein n=1 Tax=Georgenia satyanarayanai TaxID=860221 RepID=UPI00203DD7F2|nr:hypothetical protein [Georgenia satyanarayanai]MCM3660901.1 hypothetical protein [Georgenia satyanarayanai]